MKMPAPAKAGPSANARPPVARAGRTLGPVADLEAHLPPEWWKELFDSIYLKTDGDVVDNDTNTIQEVDALVAATGIDQGDDILDLCCGQGRHVLELARRGYRNVVGVDRSRYLVRLARRRARLGGLQANFREGDARTLRLKESAFDCVYLMGNSFGFFAEAEDDLRVVEAIKRVLRSGGSLALDLADGDYVRAKYEPRSWEWIDQNHFVCRERSISADGDRLIAREIVTHAERGVIADRFYAERLYDADRIRDLLSQANFGDITFHGALNPAESRGQDLGMMAHRLFLTAEGPPKKATAKPGQRGKVEVAVVMGDPRLPDSVKKNGVFNPEDFDTIQRLKDALGTLNGYSFSYLDDHSTLISDLLRLKTDLVMNLCDEGYCNDAFRELHVPAMFELIGLPYTGAGPQCLAACYDKALVRGLAISLDVPVPAESYISAEDQSAALPSVFPAILKPNYGDSSIGITKDAIVHGPEELVASLARVREIVPGRPILVQEFLTGTEYSVGMIGNPGQDLFALPILEVDYSGLDESLPRILGYESKWLPDSPYWTDIRYCEAQINPDEARAMVQNASVMFERLGCRDYARFDFRAASDGSIKLLEVNPNPGWSWDAKMNLMGEMAGRNYADLLRSILDAAVERLRIEGRIASAIAA